MSEKKKVAGIAAPRYIFLGIVVLLYFAVYLFQPQHTIDALVGFWSMAKKVVPVLVFVFILLVFFHKYIKPDMVRRLLGKDSGIRGWLLAVIGGILMMGPPYILYPMLAEMRKMGARDGLLAVFLYNRNVKIPFLPVMILCFGLRYSLILSIFIIIFSIINGILVEWFMKSKTE